jgi:hypothetical protein
VTAVELAANVRAAVRAFAAASDAASIASLASAAAASLVEHLGSLAAAHLEADAAESPNRADGYMLAAPALARELRAFAEALQ